MRCHICDKPLGETEVKFNRKYDQFDPCVECLTVIGEVFQDPIPEEQLKIDEENT